MQLTQLLLTLAAASSLTSARQIPPHCNGLDRSPPCTKWTGAAAVKIEAHAESEEKLLARRGAIDDYRTQAICKGTWKADKTKYKDLCSHETGGDDGKNFCMLSHLLEDATPACKRSPLKSLGF